MRRATTPTHRRAAREPREKHRARTRLQQQQHRATTHPLGRQARDARSKQNKRKALRTHAPAAARSSRSRRRSTSTRARSCGRARARAHIERGRAAHASRHDKTHTHRTRRGSFRFHSNATHLERADPDRARDDEILRADGLNSNADTDPDRPRTATIRQDELVHFKGSSPFFVVSNCAVTSRVLSIFHLPSFIFHLFKLI